MINIQDIESMYVVGAIGDWFGGNVELFSPQPGGEPACVYVYDRASTAEFAKGLEKAHELDIPLLLGEEDIDQRVKQGQPD